MAHDPQALTIKPAAWGPASTHWLAQAVQHANVEELRQQVESGAASLFHLEAGGEVAGAFVLRVETRPMGTEGVILAAAGRVPGINMIDTIFPHLEAIFKDCASIRYHTASPALARRLATKGYAVSEIVCKKDLKK